MSEAEEGPDRRFPFGPSLRSWENHPFLMAFPSFPPFPPFPPFPVVPGGFPGSAAAAASTNASRRMRASCRVAKTRRDNMISLVRWRVYLCVCSVIYIYVYVVICSIFITYKYLYMY